MMDNQQATPKPQITDQQEAAFHAALQAEFLRGTFMKVERPGLIPRDDR